MNKQTATITALAVAGLFVLVMVLSGFYTVEQGERGVVLRAGALTHVAEPGFHLKVPFLDSVKDMEVRTKKLVIEKVLAYSSDIQQSSNSLAVNYRLPENAVAMVFKKYGHDYENRIISPAVQDKFKEVFGKYTAAQIVGERQRVGDEVFRAIAEEIRPSGIVVEAVQIQNIDFTDEFEKAIEAAVKAKAEVTQAEQILLRKRIEAEQIVVVATAQANAQRQQAQGAADAQVMQAKGAAEARVLSGKAEAEYVEALGRATAEALRVKAAAVANNRNIVDLEIAHHWDGKLPATMLPGGSVPFVSVK